MTLTRLTRVATGLALALAVAAPAVAEEMDHSKMGHGAPAGAAMSPASDAYMKSMTDMDKAMKDMKMTGKPDADFVLMMIPHHQAAIDMAKAYLASGDKDPELTKLANEIVAAQDTEISFMRGWLKKKGY